METIEVAVVVLCFNHRVWVQRRSEEGLLDGLLEFPGGKLRAREDPEQAAVREFFEECGVLLEQQRLRLLHLAEHRYPDRRVRIHFFLARADPGSQPQGGHWIELSQLRPEDFPEANREAIERLFDMSDLGVPGDPPDGG